MTDSPKPKVLVIDDEAGPRESLRMVLKNQYEVLLADHVDAGLALLKEQEPDMVIMDIRMPGKNGIDGLRELRTIDSRVAVVMLTGFGSLETAQEAIRLGANDYLKKPFDIREIEETVRRGVQHTQLERRKTRALEELHQLNLQLHEQIALKEKWAVVGEASREFAHDLRNPLTIILGYCDLLAEQLRQLHETKANETAGDTLQYMKNIEDNVQRCYQLAEQWQKSDQQARSGYETIALDKLLEETVKSMEPLNLLGQDKVDYTVAAEPVQVQADRLQLLRAIYNVVTNALHALPTSGGKITLSCRAAAKQARIEVVDNGSGIAPAVLDRVFDHSFTTKPPDKGTGLGLYITRKIVEDHGGQVSIQSREGQGTRVTIVLPLAEEGH